MLRIINKTDNALSIENYELPERGSLEIDIPYTSNLRMMEKYNMIAVVQIDKPVLQESETSADESVKNDVVADIDNVSNEVSTEEVTTVKRKRSRKTNN